MTAQKVLEEVAKMPYEDLVTIQNGIVEMMVANFTPGDIAEIDAALKEAEAEIEQGEAYTIDEVKKKLGLK